jgi:hypothetical protein
LNDSLLTDSYECGKSISSTSSTQKFLLLVDNLKSGGNFFDYVILTEAYKQISSEDLE